MKSFETAVVGAYTESPMSKAEYTEGRLRRFVLLHYSTRLPFPTPSNVEWHPIAVGFHVPRRGKRKGGSIDILFMSNRGGLLIAEIKKRDNTERGRQPIEQAIRYWKGLQEVAGHEEFISELVWKWKLKGTDQWIRHGPPGVRVSSRFLKAMHQLYGPESCDLLEKAFDGMKSRPPSILIIQNGELHPPTRDAIHEARTQGTSVWGIGVSFPEEQATMWSRYPAK